MKISDRFPSPARAGLPSAWSALAGCQGGGDSLPREPVSGTVTLDGQPLGRGLIQMLPASRKEGVAGGALIESGKFSLGRGRGLVPGEYRVVINSPEPEKDAPESGGGAPGTVEAGSAPRDLIPVKYNENSTLVAEVKAGAANSFDFALTTK